MQVSHLTVPEIEGIRDGSISGSTTERIGMAPSPSLYDIR